MLPGLLPEGADINEAKKALISTVPLGRLVEPEEVASTALFLASDDSAMVTGSCIFVDGGRGI
jgi:3-oxoacyl-[acyl-carrier protein] reductase